MFDLVIRNGHVVGPGIDTVMDVAVDGEVITAIGHGLRGRRELDATGLLVVPGAVDGHVHIRTERAEWSYDDTFRTGSVAAAFGGVTTFLDQVQVEPGVRLCDALAGRQGEARGECLVDYGFHVNPREPSRERIDEIPEVVQAGVPTIKFFMSYEGWALSDDLILRGMQHVAAAGGLAIVHAENKAVIEELVRQQLELGRSGPQWHAAARPASMEAEASHRALALARLAGARVLLYHVTAAESVEELRRARRHGDAAFGEACLHYLVLDESAILDPVTGPAFEVSPPLRDAGHRDALWRALADGTLDVVSTDHGPRRRVRDAAGELVPPPGTSGIEVRLALVHDLGVRTGLLSLQRWVEVCCTRPADVFGLPTKGRLLPGLDADIVLFDPDREVMLSAPTLHSQVDHSTYEGMRVRGFPVTTISRGEIVVEDGTLAAEPGRGRLAPRGWRPPGRIG